jgi:hypothetical protein
MAERRALWLVLHIAQPYQLESQHIQFGIGLFPHETQNLFRVIAQGRAYRWRFLLDQLDHPVRGRLSAQSRVLHVVE